VLREITGVSHDPGGNARRWFHDDYFDLFVRQDEEGEIVGLELCYGVGHSEHALVWRKGTGHFHDGPEADRFNPDDLRRGSPPSAARFRTGSAPRCCERSATTRRSARRRARRVAASAARGGRGRKTADLDPRTHPFDSASGHAVP